MIKQAYEKPKRKFSGKFAVVLNTKCGRYNIQNKPSPSSICETEKIAIAKASRMNKNVSKGQFVVIELIEVETDGEKSYIIN